MTTQNSRQELPQGYIANPSAMAHDRSDDLSLRRLFGVIWRRLPTLLLTMLSVLALAYFVLSQLTPHYLSKALILIEDEKAGVFPQSAGTPSVTSDPVSIQSQVEIIQSREMGLDVVVQLDLHTLEEFLKEKPVIPFLPQPVAVMPEPYEVERDGKVIVVPAIVFENFRKALSVRHQPNTKVISIEFVSENPNVSADVVNALAENYIQRTLDSKINETLRTSRLLESEVEQLKRKAEESERLLGNFKQRSGLTETIGADLIAQQIAQLNSQLINIRTERVEAEARFNQVQRLAARGNGISAIEVLDSPVVQRLRDEELRLRQQKQELSQEYGALHPRMLSLQAQTDSVKDTLNQEIQRIINGVRDKVEITRAREASMEQSLASLKSQISTAKQSEVEMKGLEREAQSNKQLLESFLARVKEADTRAGGAFYQADASLIARGYPAIESSFPKIGPKMVIAFVASLLLGLMMVFLKDSLENQNEEEFIRMPSSPQPMAPTMAPTAAVETGNITPLRPSSAAMPMPLAAFSSLDASAGMSGQTTLQRGTVNVLGTLPLSSLAPDTRVLTLSALQAAAHNPAVMTITMAIPEFLGDAGARSILVTSSDRSAARTSFVVAAAAGLAGMGKKILLLDLDFSAPSLHEAFGVNNERGMLDYLSGSQALGKLILTDRSSGIDLMPAGHRDVAPSGLFNHDVLMAVVEYSLRSYDLVLMIGSPFLISTDIQRFIGSVDRAVYVLPERLRQNAKVIDDIVKRTKAGEKSAGIVFTK